MLALLSKLSLLVEISESKDACSLLPTLIEISNQEGHDTIKDYLDYIKENNASLAHLIWARKNFVGDVNNAILFEYSKMFIDAVGKTRAIRRFKNMEITLIQEEIDYLDSI